MSITTVAPVTRALVQALRADSGIAAGVTGGIHEGFAPDGTAWPFIVYHVHWSNYVYDWGKVTLKAMIGIQIVSDDQVGARNLDALVMTALHDAALTVSGQTTMFCRRTGDLQSVDVDEQGKRVYMVGGMYDIWTDQPLA